MKKCYKCKNTLPKSEFYKDSYRKDDLAGLCKTCSRENALERWHKKPDRLEYARQQYQKHRTDRVAQSKIYNQTVRGKFIIYRKRAKRKGYDFKLTLEMFKHFWQKPCAYCGSRIGTIGIDRINNDLGYTLDNCISCCPTCNRMKNNTELDKWIQHMEKIIEKTKEEFDFTSSRFGQWK